MSIIEKKINLISPTHQYTMKYLRSHHGFKRMVMSLLQLYCQTRGLEPGSLAKVIILKFHSPMIVSQGQIISTLILFPDFSFSSAYQSSYIVLMVPSGSSSRSNSTAVPLAGLGLGPQYEIIKDRGQIKIKFQILMTDRRQSLIKTPQKFLHKQYISFIKIHIYMYHTYSVEESFNVDIQIVFEIICSLQANLFRIKFVTEQT